MSTPYDRVDNEYAYENDKSYLIIDGAPRMDGRSALHTVELLRCLADEIEEAYLDEITGYQWLVRMQMPLPLPDDLEKDDDADE